MDEDLSDQLLMRNGIRLENQQLYGYSRAPQPNFNHIRS